LRRGSRLPFFFVTPSLQGAKDLLHAVRLDHIVDFDVVVTGDFQTTLETLTDFADVVLEALERFEAHGPVRRRIDDDSLPDQADLGRALDRTFRDKAAGDRADAADLEGLANDRPAQMDDLFARLELAFERGFDVVRQVVNDVVLADLDRQGRR
jgi:hypothetical protein